MKDPNTIHVGDGQGEGFWDVGFTDDQIDYAEVDVDDMRAICVSIDGDRLSLNDGYAPLTPPHRDENALFDTFRDAITEALVADHRIQRDHPAFVERARIRAVERAEALADLARRMREWDEEDAA